MTETLEFPGTVGGHWDRYIDPASIHPLHPPAPSPLRGGLGRGAKRVHGASPPSPSLREDDRLRSGDFGSPVLVGPIPAEGRGPEEELRIGTVKYPRTIPRDETCAKELKKRTLTNLYNHRPAWLDLAHRRLDEAVFAAYGWPPTLTDDELLAKLLELNLQRAVEQSN